MATTLSNGYIKPDTGDRGSTFFPGLEDNIERLNSHNHDGSNSEKIPASSINNPVQTLSSAGWTLISPSVYRQLVTMPTPLAFDSRVMQFQISSGANAGKLFHPTIVKQTVNTFYLFCNDNSFDVLVKYT